MCKLKDLIERHPYSRTRHIRRGDEIRMQGNIGLVVSGVVTVTPLSERGTDLITRLISKGGFLGVLPTDSVYQTIDDCLVTALPSKYVQGVDAALMEAMAKENNELTLTILNLTNRRVVDRLRWAVGVLGNVGIVKRGQRFPPGTITLLARLIGADICTVSREIKRLK